MFNSTTDPPVKLPSDECCQECGGSILHCDCDEWCDGCGCLREDCDCKWSGGVPSTGEDGIISSENGVGRRRDYWDRLDAAQRGEAVTLTDREERLREPGGPVSELVASGEGDTINTASRLFFVRLDDAFTQDPLRIVQGVVKLGDEHPRAPGLYAVRFIAEERLTEKAIRCRVEYEIGRWEWCRRNSGRWDEAKYDRDVRGTRDRPSLVEPCVDLCSESVSSPWSWETSVIVAMIPVAACVYFAVPAILRLISGF